DIRPPFAPLKQQTIADLPYFPATRFVFQTRRRFWQAAGLSGSVRTDRPAEIWDAAYDLSGARGMLGATLGGSVGRLLLNMTDDQCLAYGKDVVADALPGIRA